MKAHRMSVGVAALLAAATALLTPAVANAAPRLTPDQQQPPGGSFPTSAQVHGYQFHTEIGGMNGSYCGPAATRLALTAQGKYPSQHTLGESSNLNTNNSGETDNIGLVTKTLNKYIGYGFYQTKWGSSATWSKLQWDLEYDISHGYVIVGNVYGIAYDTQGRARRYSGGHYLDVVGYYDNGHRLIIEDIAYPRTPSSGSGMHRRYNMTTTNFLNWIKPRGYSA